MHTIGFLIIYGTLNAVLGIPFCWSMVDDKELSNKLFHLFIDHLKTDSNINQLNARIKLNHLKESHIT